MKRTKILWGISLLAMAALIVLEILGVDFGLPDSISLRRLLVAVFFGTVALSALIRLRLPQIFFPLIFIVMLFEKELADLLGLPDGNITSVWVFLLIGLLLTAGTAILFPSRLRRRLIDGLRRKKVKKTEPPRTERAAQKKKPGGHSVHYIDCNETFEEHVENNLGSCEVFFTNTASYVGNGILRVENNMGQTVLHIPETWCVISSIENNMGAVHIDRQNGMTGAKQITLTGENNMGSVRVEFVRE